MSAVAPFHPLPHDDDAEAGRSFADYLAILKRRGRLMMLTMGGLLLVAIVVALALPPVFRSTATILIQEQEIPQELVRSTVTSFADERIQVISQQVMTRSVLLDLVNRYSLYEGVRQRETSEELLDRMRGDIKLSPISADVTDRRTGSQTKATIAFTLAYMSESASDAQKIANELTTLFLNENVKNRQQKAAETASFLDEELARLNVHISEVEKKLADFKERNHGRLPELTAINLQSRERTEGDLQRTERDIQSLEERKILLEGQLAQVKPRTPVVAGATGLVVLEPEERLKAARTQLASAIGLYSEDHPDVKNLRREIKSLETETGDDGRADDRQQKIDELEGRIATLREKYSDAHPDVVALRRTLASLRDEVERHPARKDAAKPDNPVYISTQTQIDSTNAEIASTRALQRELRAKLADVEDKLVATPEVEREYLELTRDQDSSRLRFRELREKQMQAQVAEQLERDRKAERFTLIDPPIYPEKPFSPNRIAIVLIGAVIALLGGIAAVGFSEANDHTVRNPDDMVRALRAPVLALIPMRASAAALRRRSLRRRTLVAGALIGLVLFTAWFHYFVMPLEVAWFGLLRRLAL